eukprot:g1486.t1
MALVLSGYLNKMTTTSLSVEGLSIAGTGAPTANSCESYFEDVTPLLRQCCSDLKRGEMLHTPSFSLFNAMSAIELMDPKMDSGMKRERVVPVEERIQIGYESMNPTATSASTPPVTTSSSSPSLTFQLTARDIIGISDTLLVLQEAWLCGHTLPQTVFTCLYLHREALGVLRKLAHAATDANGTKIGLSPSANASISSGTSLPASNATTDAIDVSKFSPQELQTAAVLYALCLCQLQFMYVTRNAILRADLYEQEEFVPNLFGLKLADGDDVGTGIDVNPDTSEDAVRYELNRAEAILEASVPFKGPGSPKLSKRKKKKHRNGEDVAFNFTGLLPEIESKELLERLRLWRALWLIQVDFKRPGGNGLDSAKLRLKLVRQLLGAMIKKSSIASKALASEYETKPGEEEKTTNLNGMLSVVGTVVPPVGAFDMKITDLLVTQCPPRKIALPTPLGALRRIEMRMRHFETVCKVKECSQLHELMTYINLFSTGLKCGAGFDRDKEETSSLEEWKAYAVVRRKALQSTLIESDEMRQALEADLALELKEREPIWATDVESVCLQQPCVLSRSWMLIVLYAEEQVVTNLTLQQLVSKSLEGFGTTEDLLLIPEVQQYISRVLKPVYDVMKLKCLCRPRQRRRLRHMFSEWSMLQENADYLDNCLNARGLLEGINEQRESKENAVIGPTRLFGLWNLEMSFEMMVHWVLLGLELDLHSRHELDSIYWYLDYLLGAQLHNRLMMRNYADRRFRYFLNHALHKFDSDLAAATASAERKATATNSPVSASKRNKKKKRSKKKKPSMNENALKRRAAYDKALTVVRERQKRIVIDKIGDLLLDARRCLCNGLFHLSAAVRSMGHLPNDASKSSDEESFGACRGVFEHRFKPLDSFSQPKKLSFEIFQSACDDYKSKTENDAESQLKLLTMALDKMTQAKKTIEAVQKVEKTSCYCQFDVQSGIKALLRVAVGNSVAALQLKREIEMKRKQDSNVSERKKTKDDSGTREGKGRDSGNHGNTKRKTRPWTSVKFDTHRCFAIVC